MTNILKCIENVKNATDKFKLFSIEKRNKIIKEIWLSIKYNKKSIIRENQKDLKKMDINDPMYDRLLLMESRIDSIIKSCNDLIKIEDPILKYKNQKNIITIDWLTINKVGIPIWVVACIYEARPNVTIDITIMCIKSSNWIILRWGTKAKYSNRIFIKLIKEVFIKNKVSSDLIYNYPLDKIELEKLYNAVWLVDVIIPRWGKNLINSVREKSKIPVIETWAWIVHQYLDKDINKENNNKAINIIINSKTNRFSVCNALDTLIINKNINSDLKKILFTKLDEKWVKIRVLQNQTSYLDNLTNNYSIIEYKNLDQELLSLNLNIIFVHNLKKAIQLINKYSSQHSDWIISDNKDNINIFKQNIDSSVVYSNTSTRFSDWYCFWFAWEIWISTQKLHARWPMWADSLITYKYLVNSPWQIRK